MAEVLVTAYGGPDVVHVREAGEPRPGQGEVRVRMEATGLAWADVLMRYGRYPQGPRVPFVPGYDVVGRVDAVGGRADPRWVGRRVAAITMTGSNAHHVLVPVGGLVPVPEDVEATEAVALVLNYVTAFQVLRRIGASAPSGWVYVQGAGGGVGTALLDLCRHDGRPAVGSASAGKHHVVERFGATAVDYREHDLPGTVRTVTGGGAALALDGLGGRGLRESWATLRAGGRLVSYGLGSAVHSRRPGMVHYLSQAARLAGWNALPDGRSASQMYAIMRYRKRHPELFRTDLAHLLTLLAAGRLHPVIGAVLPLRDAREAHRMLEERTTTGKIVLVPGS